MTKPKISAASSGSPTNNLAPEEVFLVLFRQAIDSATALLEDAGLTDEAIWATYRSALNVLAKATVDVETESPTALAA